MQVRETFSVRAKGRYHIEVWIPSANPKEDAFGSANGTLECKFSVKIKRNDTTVIDATIPSLIPSGAYLFGGTVLYSSGENWELTRGEYQIEISSIKVPEIISSHGAVIEFTQYQKPVEWLLVRQLRRTAGLALSIIGIVAMISLEFKKHN